MSYRQRSRPDRRWLSWSGDGVTSQPALRVQQQPFVENLEHRRLLSSIHFVGDLSVVVDLQTRTVTVSGKIAGVGNDPVQVTTSVAGSAHLQAQNPGQGGGPHFPPGQQIDFTLSHTESFQADKNGNVIFTEVVSFDDSSILDTTGPNPKWTVEVTNVIISNVTVTATQGDQTISQFFPQ